jgi:hypothetical protein
MAKVESWFGVEVWVPPPGASGSERAFPTVLRPYCFGVGEFWGRMSETLGGAIEC